jgi:hypothetical protein
MVSGFPELTYKEQESKQLDANCKLTRPVTGCLS